MLVPGFCNETCKHRHENAKPKPRRKYGIGGQVYDNYKEGDVFKWHKPKGA